MENKFSVSEKNPLHKKYTEGPYGIPMGKVNEKNLEVVIAEIISQRPDYVKEQIRNIIKNNPFVGIYGMKDLSSLEKKHIVAILRDINIKTHDILHSEVIGAASIIREMGGTEAIPTPFAGKELLEQYSGWITGEEKKGRRGLLRKAITEPGGMHNDEMRMVVDQIKNEDIKIVEYINVIVTALDIVDTEAEDTWIFEFDLGYLYGLISQAEINKSIEDREFTTSNIDILGKPIAGSNYTKPFKKLKDEPEIVNHAKLLEYLDVIKEKANELIQEKETGKTISDKSVVRPSEEDLKVTKLRGYKFREEKKKKKATEEGEGAKNVPIGDGGSGTDIPFQETEIEEEDTRPIEEQAAEWAQAKEEEETINELKSYRIVFGRQGNIKLELEVSINNEIIKHHIEMWGDTLSDLLTDAGFNYIINSISENMKEFIGKAPYTYIEERVEREEMTGETPLKDVNNGRYYYYIYNINTNELIKDNVRNPEEFEQYSAIYNKESESEL